MKRKLHLTDTLLILILGVMVLFVSFIPAYGEKYAPFFFNSTLYSVFAIALIALLGTYFFYEARYNKFKINKFFALAFLLLVIENIIVTLAQPDNVWITCTIATERSIVDDFRTATIFQQSGLSLPIDMMFHVGDKYTILADLNPEYKWFGITALFAQLALIYLVIFVLPKKLPSQKILKFIVYAVFAVGAISILYSYIAEFKLYIQFFNNLFGEHSYRTDPCIQSFTGQHNVYGMLLMIVLFFAMINHSMNKKWWNYLIMIFAFVNIIFSTSRGSLICGAIMLGLYIVSRLFITIKEHKKRNLTILICIGAVALLGLGAVLIAAITKGNTFGFIYEALNKIPQTDTIVMRTKIWNNTIQLLNDNNGWLFGRGFTLLLRMLYPMNALNGDPVFVPHNGFLRLIGFGGILMVLVFTLLIIYMIKVTIKRFKINKSIAMSCFIGAFAFLIYSIIESNHLIILFMFFPMLIIDAEQEEKEYKLKEQTLIYPLTYDSAKTKSQTFAITFTLCSALISGMIYPLIDKAGIITILLPVGLLLLEILISYLLFRKEYNGSTLKDYLSSIGAFILINLVTLTICPLFMFGFKELDFVRGLLIGLAFLIIELLVIINNKKIRRQSGKFIEWSIKFDEKIERIYKKII